MLTKTGKSLFVCSAFIALLLLLGSLFAFASDRTASSDQVGSAQSSKQVGSAPSSNQTIFLHTGSPLILYKGEIKPLDPQNPDVAAIVADGRTLLPLRALSEYFGAVVSYDSSKKEAVIDYQNKKYIFTINKNKYIVADQWGKKEFKMDAKPFLLNQRTMVPMRVICENVLGRKVSYYDRVIAVADQDIDLKKDTKLTESIRLKIGEAVKPRSIKELKLALSLQNMEKDIKYSGLAIPENAAPMQDAEAAKAPAVSDSNAVTDYTKTLTQVEGIDEADIVKTDGKYIYISANNAVRIVGADRGKLSDDGTIILGNNKSVQEIYVDGDRLVLLGTRSEFENGPIYPLDDRAPLLIEDTNRFIPPYYHSKTYSFIDVYDIYNPKKPLFLKEHEMEGIYQTSRKNGGIVYLVTNTMIYRDDPLPLMKDSVSGSKESNLNLDDVLILPRCPATGYIILSAVDINNKEKSEVEAIAASGSILYMNEKALYLAGNHYDNKSIIHKFNINGMKIGYAGSGAVKGELLNQFSMDEHNGFLRVATTTWEEGNGIYILDGSLNLVGSIDQLAKGERIYSVRFMGDKGYVVTFRNMDPLFVFDLSVPNSPKLTGELKIPGFSNYLQPVGENLILGIGADTYEIYRKDADGKDVVIGNRQGGIKLSLFDVSDMGKPKEISKYVVGGSGSYTEAFHNHKAVMLDEKNKNAAFDASVSDNQNANSKQALILMNYDKGQLTLKGLLESKPLDYYGKYTPYARRAVVVGDVLYYIQDGRISSYDYKKLTDIDTIELQ